MQKLKTYSHLMPLGRIPSEYEIVSSQLHYHTHLGLEVKIPFVEWYKEYQKLSALQCDDWEIFSDPGQTTYSGYMARQSRAQNYLEGMFSSWGLRESSPMEAGRFLAWRDFSVPLLYTWHGLQMVAAYLGQLAPSGKITIVCAFQVADEIRRIQNLACRLGQLRRMNLKLCDTRSDTWQKDPLWQPLRQLVEELLVTYDWSESFVALNLCLKPLLDHLFLRELPRLFEALEERTLMPLFDSFYTDSEWQLLWSRELIRVLFEAKPENRDVVKKILARWTPRAENVVQTFARAWQKFSKVHFGSSTADFDEATLAFYQKFYSGLMATESGMAQGVNQAG